MIKKLAGCIREYKAAAILTPITVTFEVILEVIIPMLMAVLIDRGINRGSLPDILKTGALLVGCCVVSLLCGADSARRPVRDLRKTCVTICFIGFRIIRLRI